MTRSTRRRLIRCERTAIRTCSPPTAARHDWPRVRPVSTYSSRSSTSTVSPRRCAHTDRREWWTAPRGCTQWRSVRAYLPLSAPSAPCRSGTASGGAGYLRRSPSASAAEAEQVLADLAHLDLFRSFGDAIAAVVPVDVLERHVPAVAETAARLHCPVGGVTRETVGAVVAHRDEVRHLHVVLPVE